VASPLPEGSGTTCISEEASGYVPPARSHREDRFGCSTRDADSCRSSRHTDRGYLRVPKRARAFTAEACGELCNGVDATCCRKLWQLTSYVLDGVKRLAGRQLGTGGPPVAVGHGMQVILDGLFSLRLDCAASAASDGGAENERCRQRG
jgi:hypothetical protein